MNRDSVLMLAIHCLAIRARLTATFSQPAARRKTAVCDGPRPKGAAGRTQGFAEASGAVSGPAQDARAGPRSSVERDAAVEVVEVMDAYIGGEPLQYRRQDVVRAPFSAASWIWPCQVYGMRPDAYRVWMIDIGAPTLKGYCFPRAVIAYAGSTIPARRTIFRGVFRSVRRASSCARSVGPR